jgi:hypothetical protein
MIKLSSDKHLEIDKNDKNLQIRFLFGIYYFQFLDHFYEIRRTDSARS